MLATYERVFVTNNIPDGGPIIWTGLVWVLCTCMAIGSKVECSFAALAGDFSLLAHPCSRTILLQLHGEFDGGADVKSLPVLFATSTIGGGLSHNVWPESSPSASASTAHGIPKTLEQSEEVPALRTRDYEVPYYKPAPPP